MKASLKLTATLILIGFSWSSNLFGHEFKNFKLTEKLNKEIQKKSLKLQKANSSIGTVIAEGQREAELYQQIINHISPNYQQIGEVQTSNILNQNYNFDLGKENRSGFTWQKPMGSFRIGVDRQVEPDLFSERWIVKDKFVISINAFSYLTNLKEEGKIDITQDQLAAFIGMEFVRLFKFFHFASSYEDGLTKEYNKLFLILLKFKDNSILQLEENEFISKEDHLTFNAGGFVNAPGMVLTPGITANVSAGVLIDIEKLSQLTLQGPSEEESETLLKASYLREERKLITARAELELDFLQLLKLTLLEYELSYDFKRGDELHLTFPKSIREELLKDGQLGRDFKELLRLKRPDNLSTLKPYLVSQEQSITENLNSKYSIFFLGAEKKAETKQIVIQKENESKTFFRSRVENIRFVKGLFMELLNGLFESIFDAPLLSNYKLARSRLLQFEYELNGEADPNKVIIDDSGKLSLTITHSLRATSLKSFFNKNLYKDYAADFTDNFTTLSTLIGDQIENGNLKAPLNISTIFRITKTEIDYFNNLSTSNVKLKIDLLCKQKSNFKENKCKKDLRKRYQSYKEAWLPNQTMALWKLKDFLVSMNKYADHRAALQNFFGKDIFFSGSFQATNANGQAYITYFKSGTFKNLGVVDQYMRADSVREPASIADSY